VIAWLSYRDLVRFRLWPVAAMTPKSNDAEGGLRARELASAPKVGHPNFGLTRGSRESSKSWAADETGKRTL
jgi:hypothetical protein